MRFDPPPVALPTELCWLLAAAFGPRLPPMTGDPDVASALALRFDLAPRIVARHGSDRIGRRLGEAAPPLVRAHRRSVAVAMAAERAAVQVARLAARADLPIIFLKGHAVRLTTSAPAGRRPFVDLDVLLARSAADELRAALLAEGWRAAREAGNPQHLAPVTAPEGTPLDIHYRLRGIRVATARWATAEELLAADLCRPAGLAAGAWIPRPPLLAAHLAVHAVEQHGHRPASYPLLRAAADLADLTAFEGGEGLAQKAGRLVGDDLADDELRALFALGRLLAEGRLPSADVDGERGAERLLRHVVAGALDPVYRRGLALDHTAGRLRQARRDGDLMRYIARKLKGPARRPEAVAGESGGNPTSVRRRVLHQIQVGVRFASAAAARLRQTFQR